MLAWTVRPTHSPPLAALRPAGACIFQYQLCSIAFLNPLSIAVDTVARPCLQPIFTPAQRTAFSVLAHRHSDEIPLHSINKSTQFLSSNLRLYNQSNFVLFIPCIAAQFHCLPTFVNDRSMAGPWSRLRPTKAYREAFFTSSLTWKGVMKFTAPIDLLHGRNSRYAVEVELMMILLL